MKEPLGSIKRWETEEREGVKNEFVNVGYKTGRMGTKKERRRRRMERKRDEREGKKATERQILFGDNKPLRASEEAQSETNRLESCKDVERKIDEGERKER